MRYLLLLLVIGITAAEDSNAGDKDAAKAAQAARENAWRAEATPDPKWTPRVIDEFPESMRGVWWLAIPGSDLLSEDRVVSRGTIAPLRAPHFMAIVITAFYEGDKIRMIKFGASNSPVKYTDVLVDKECVDELVEFGKSIHLNQYVIK